MNSRPFSQPDALTEGVAETLLKLELTEAVAITDDESLVKAILKVLPKQDVTNYNNDISWSKRGGYSGEKMVDRIKEKLLTLGFKKGSVGGSNSPDGSNVGFRETLVHKKLGWEAHLFKNYGSTASSNSYSARIKKSS